MKIKKKAGRPKDAPREIKKQINALYADGSAQKVLIDYILGVVKDTKAKEQRRDRMARILLPYLCLRLSREKKERRPKEEKVKLPHGKKARKAALAETAGEDDSKWKGLL